MSPLLWATSSFQKATIMNCDCKTFIVQSTVATIVNYDHNTFIVQVTVATIVNCDHSTFIVQSTVATIINYDHNTSIQLEFSVLILDPTTDGARTCNLVPLKSSATLVRHLSSKVGTNFNSFLKPTLIFSPFITSS
jgi:hypothetical protein